MPTPPRPDRAIPAALSGLYQEVILDHYRRPRNRGQLEDATHHITLNNPLCGDVIELMLKVAGGKIEVARFMGRGCSISLASASMLTGRVAGQTTGQASEISAEFTRLLHGDQAPLADARLGDLRTLAGVSRFPVRIKCALLGWNCLDELLRPESAESE